LMWAALLGIVAAFGAVLFIVIILIVNTFTQPIVAAGEEFMTALKQGDYERAYTLCTPELQDALGSQAGMAELVQNYQPTEWNWTSRSIRNGVGRLSGSFTYADGKTGSVHLVLRQIGSDWRLVSFSMNPTG
jgi:hypothetical protein